MSTQHSEKSTASSWKVTLAALGVVYGDIGTSPLYALRECFHGPHAVEISHESVLGLLSLIIWSLILVVSVKYLLVVLRADNRGEGGILALMALVCGPQAHRARRAPAIVMLGLFGAALLYGDGMITPAISILSALEGVEVVAPALAHFVLPMAVIILLVLFGVQRQGTGKVGVAFGPITLLWFVVIAMLGARAVIQHPAVLWALSPHHAVLFFMRNGMHGFVVLGSVFLVVTGGEALYADMGHFGRTPIRQAWFAVVLPALVINYLGQAAVLLDNPDARANPFYAMAPQWAMVPLIVLSTLATVIASQAVITGAFSVTWQAVQLGFLPRFSILHTSAERAGQIFIPQVNNLLLVATVGLVLGFKNSTNLASAYGIAVTTTMVITTLLASIAMRKLWHWRWFAVLSITALFLVVDLSFFGANLLKVADGGWLPLSIGALITVVMLTWRDGRLLLGERLMEKAVTAEAFNALATRVEAATVQGTAVYFTGDVHSIPAALERTLVHMKVKHRCIVILYVEVVQEAYAFVEEQVTIHPTEPGSMHRITARHGFMERANVPRLLRMCSEKGCPINLDDVTYILSRETLLATSRPGLAIWREKLFALLARNAGTATEHFRIPADQMFEIGAQVEL